MYVKHTINITIDVFARIFMDANDMQFFLTD